MFISGIIDLIGLEHLLLAKEAIMGIVPNVRTRVLEAIIEMVLRLFFYHIMSCGQIIFLL